MKKKHIWIFLWVFSLLTTFIVTLLNHLPYFVLGGSSSIAPIMEELLHNYPNHNKKGDFNYVSSASAGAPTRVENGLFSIGWLSKEYKPANPNLFTFQLMRDELVIVYNLPNLKNPNEILNFNSDIIKKIYLGTKQWNNIFPTKFKYDMPIKCFTRPNGSGTREIFDNKVIKKNHYKSNTLDSSTAMLNLEPGSIGYASFSEFNQIKKPTVRIGKWISETSTVSDIQLQKNKCDLWRPFTGLINCNCKYKTEIAHLLKWIFSFDSTVTKIFKKYGSRIELDDPENYLLKNWLDNC